MKPRNGGGAKERRKVDAMMDRSKDDKPASVPDGAMQAGEDIRARWPFAEPSIWTDRMLTALEQGVKGGKWFSLCDKAFSVRSLEAAFKKVKANQGAPGVDGRTVSRFERDLARELPKLSEALMAGTYRPQLVRRVWIPKPGSREKRPLGVPTVRDRVVQTALRACLEPIFEQVFLDRSFGFRPGRTCHQALSRIWRGLKGGKVHVVDADFKGFFDSIPHEMIMRGLESKVSDGKILELVRAYLVQGVMDAGEIEIPEEGTPQGSVVSPLLANIALHGLDTLAEEEGYELIRYADDFVILCGDVEEAGSALEAVTEWTERNGLKLHPEKTRLIDYGSDQSFDFLGFTFRKDSVFPRKKSLLKFRGKVREKTRRSSGRCLNAMVRDLNPILRGWFNYFNASKEYVFRDADGFVRRRLRAILDRRNHKHPAHRGACGKRWPNAYFEKQGLISMQALAKRQSS
jgi:RNA-directed DNA polymerase